jgi:hypothetical protein
MGADASSVLDYSTPRSFFEREYRYRSWNGAAGAVVLFGFAAFAAFMACSIPAAPGIAMKVARTLLWGVVALCAAGAGWVLFNVLRNSVDLARVTEEGIEQNRRVYPWGQVGGLGGTAVVGGVLLEFQTRSGGTPSLGLLRTVMFTPPLKREEFDTLIRMLTDYLAAEHPHVKVNPTPRSGE